MRRDRNADFSTAFAMFRPSILGGRQPQLIIFLTYGYTFP
jgi:hypothetical protein